MRSGVLWVLFGVLNLSHLGDPLITRYEQTKNVVDATLVILGILIIDMDYTWYS